MTLPRLSIQRPVAVSMFFLAAVFLGGISFTRLPIDLLPDIAYPRLVIYTTYPNVAPAEVERFVTEPVEQAVSTVPGAQGVESVTREGVSLVTVRFAWGADMDFATLNVRERLDNQRDRLPELASRPVALKTDPRSEPVLALSVAGAADLAALKELAESVFKRRLEQLEGVAQAAVVGGLEREIQVEADPRLLESYGLTIDDVARALDAANAAAPGGTVRRGRYRYALRTLGEFQSVEEIGEVVVERRRAGLTPGASARTGSGTGSGSGAGAAVPTSLVSVRDVARVRDGFRERESEARYNGQEAVGLLLFKESGANTVRVAERVDAALAQLRREYPDIRLEVAMSQAGFVADAISNVTQALVLGGLLAFLVLFLFLRDARYPVAIALSIPISVVVTFALLHAAGVTLNIMSLGGLALGVGMLVDNSIVVLENIFRRRHGLQHGGAAGPLPAGRGVEGAGGVEGAEVVVAAGPGLEGALPIDSAARGAEEVQGAITASTLTTIAVFGPIVYVQGVAGELLGPLALAVAFSLLASLVVALTLLPTMAARWQGGAATAGPAPGPVRRWSRLATRPVRRLVARLATPPLDAFDRGFARFAAWYHRLLERALEHRGRVVAITVALLLATMALGLFLKRGVLPEVDQGAFRVRLELPRGTPLEQTAAAARRVEEVLRADPEVEAVFSRVGRQQAVAGVDAAGQGINTATLEVRLQAHARTEGVLDRLRPRLAGFPPGALALETGQATALGRLLGGAEADLVVRVRGDHLETALAYGRDLETRLAGVRSLANVRLGTEIGQPEVRVEIDRERAAAYGIEPRRVAEAVEAYMRGKVATEFVDFDRKVPVVVRLPEEARRSLETLRLLRVDGVPLRELVRTHEDVGPAEVRRLDQGRVVPVYADVAAGGLEAAIHQAGRVLAAAPPRAGLRAEIGGANEEMRRSFRELGFAFTLALLLVYMILAAQFESFTHPFTILLSVPLGIIGAILALAITGGGLNTMSLIGMVILVGIAVNNAIVKVDFINQMRRQGLSTREAILEAGRARLRPILMTTVTTVLGLAPLALGLGRGADLRAPLAVAVIGGLITATALTLIVVPVAYDLVEEARLRVSALLRGRSPAAAAPPGRLLPEDPQARALVPAGGAGEERA
ncbi:MAG: efflux RND transporter permease subunit [Gemmatimonadetes bacterium]|nr:efflux RND transporter permease subunit [Gemmatimonadota bacterium]